MPEYQISGIRTEPSWSDDHEHISHLRVEDGTIFVRKTVVDDLRCPAGARYYMVGRRGRVEVTVVTCPECGFRDYLRSSADTSVADGLFHLPRV
jgi:ferredoxin-like protein FixX